MVTVTKDMIDGWKQKYGSAYKVKFDTFDVYFRPLDRDSWISLSTKAEEDPDNFDSELETCKMCILNDVTETELKSKAGIIAILAEQIMSKSGYQPVEIEEL